MSQFFYLGLSSDLFEKMGNFYDFFVKLFSRVFKMKIRT